MKVLYLFSGTRKDKFKGEPGVDYPDTQWYGLNHLADFGVTADTKEFSDLVKSKWLARLLGFRLRHLCLFFVTKEYDVIFGASLLYMLLLKKIFRHKAKFVLFNMSLTRTLSANKNKPIKLKLLRWLLRELAGIVCLSRVQQNFLESQLPFLREKIFFVPLGVDVRFYRPNFGPRENYILSAGRDNGRDYKTVIKAAKRMPDQKFEIVCSPRNIEGIDAIPSNVIITYDIPIVELYKKYQQAKLMLLITHGDDFLDGSDCSGQTVLLDALANGVPLIATKKAYLKDYVESEKDILAVAPYDYDDIIRQIRVCEDAGKRETLARSGRMRIEQENSTVAMAGHLARIFTLLVS